MRPAKFRFCFAIIVISLTLTVSGCWPKGVSWLPDSSGFVFSSGDALVHYDLKKKASRTVVADMEAKTPWPAVSADGKSVAVAKLVTKKNTTPKLEVILFDMNGKEIKKSPAFDWGKASTSDPELERREETALAWVPGANKVLVCGGAGTGLYDAEKDTIKFFGNVIPWPVANIPVRLDGKGFLAMVEREKNASTILFLDWDGKEYAFDGLAPIRQAGQFPYMSDFFWEKEVAVLVGAKSMLRLDTDKKTSSVTDRSKGVASNDETTLNREYTFPGNASRLYSVMREKGFSIEIENAGEKGRRVIAKWGSVDYLFPSPDRNLVAIYGRPLPAANVAQSNPVILVVNQQGDVVAEVEVAP